VGGPLPEWNTSRNPVAGAVVVASWGRTQNMNWYTYAAARPAPAREAKSRIPGHVL